MHAPALRPGVNRRSRNDESSGIARVLRGLIPVLAAFVMTHAVVTPVRAAETIAKVGDEIITTDEFADFVRRYVREKLYHGGSRETLRRAAMDALETLIDERLLARAAERRGIAGDRAGVARQIEGFRKRYGDSPQWPEIEQRLPDIEKALLVNSRIEELRRVVSTVATPDERVVRAFYEANPQLFTQPAAYDIDMILIGVPPSALKPEWDEAAVRAEEVARAVSNGGDFAELARGNSTDPSAERGGALGRIHKGQLPDAAHAAVETLKPGGVAGPIRILEGFVLLRLNNLYDAQLQPFEVVRERAEGLYRRQKAESQWDAYRKQLRAETKVETFNVQQYVEAMLPGH